MMWLGNSKIEIIDGDRGVNYPKKNEFSDDGYCVFLNTKNVLAKGFNFDVVMFITKQKDSLLRKGRLERNDLVLTTRGTVGNIAIYDEKVAYEHIRINSGMVVLRPDLRYFISEYIFYLFQTEYMQKKFCEISSGSAQPQLPIRSLNIIKIPVPDLKTQKQVVVQLEKEQKAVEATRNLITLFEQKIKERIAKVWGEKTI